MKVGEQASGHPCLDDRSRRQRGAEALGDQLQVEQAGTGPTRARVHSHARPTERAHRVPEVAVEPAPRLRVAHQQGWALLREEGAERLDQLLLLVGE